MGATKYIGRVGALAVALGIGSAAATAPAWAEPSETHSSPSSSSPSSSTSDNAPSEPDSPPGTSTDDVPGTAGTASSPTTLGPSVDADPTASVSDDLDDAERPKPRVLKRKTSSHQSARESVDDRVGSTTSAPRVETIDRQSASDGPEKGAPAASTPTVAQSISPAPVADSAPDLAEVTGTDNAIAVDVAVAGPSAIPGSDAPVQTPAEWTLLAAARREIGTDATDTTAIAAGVPVASVNMLQPATSGTEPFAAAAATTTTVATIPTGNGPGWVVLSPDGTRVYVANRSSGSISVVDAATNTVIGAPIAVGSNMNRLAISPDGHRLYVTFYSPGKISVIDTATNVVVASAALGDAQGEMVVSPDGRRVYVANYQFSTVSVFNTSTNTVIGHIPVGRNPSSLAVSPDGSRVYVANYYGSSVSVIDTAINTVVGPEIPVGNSPSQLVVSSDGSRVYVVSTDDDNGHRVGLGTVSVIDTSTNSTVGDPIPVGNTVTRLLISPDGEYVYVLRGASSTDTSGIPVIDTRQNAVSRVIPLEGAPQGFFVSPDGRQVYIVSSLDGPSEYGRAVLTVDTATGAMIGQPAFVGDGYSHAAVSPNGTRLYVANYNDNTISVVDTAAAVIDNAGVTVEKLFQEMQPDKTDTIRAQLLVAPDGTKRMVVYMSGIDGGSGIDGATGNAGIPNPLVFNYIDAAVHDWDPAEIMLVGFSGGGQQMQIYAATGFYKERVKVLVLLGAGPTKTIFQIPQTVSLLISDRGDKVWDVATVGHLEALASYGVNGSDQWSWYQTGELTESDTHGVQTYIDAATDFDAYVRTPGASAGDKQIYQNIQRFNLSDKDQDRPEAMVSVQKPVFQAVQKWLQDRVTDAQNWLRDRADDFRAGVDAFQIWASDRVADAQKWVQDRAKDAQNAVNALGQGISRGADNLLHGRWPWE